jgi:hypothetical protein
MKRLAADRSRWKSFVEALYSYTGDNRKWWWWIIRGGRTGNVRLWVIQSLVWKQGTGSTWRNETSCVLRPFYNYNLLSFRILINRQF